ncbi:MAG: hypothetical protein D6744_07605 [Planctomycetota bacterium]|nr:MAG: hypothetical protein D6744_07605 [Planctomycetota bacterium]
MAAHLARHMNSMHQKTSKSAKSKPAFRLPASASAGAFGGGAVAAAVRELQNQRSQLAEQIEALDNALAALGGVVPSGAAAPRRNVALPKKRRKVAGATKRTSASAGRAPAGGSLRDHLTRVLKAASGSMRVKELEAAVLKAGYRSKSKNLGHSINKALAKMKGVKRVGRGLYKLK